MFDFQRLPLNALKTFEAVARLGSLREAAQELCVTQGAIGQQLKKLESHLAITLIQKKGRGITLSQDGQLLYQQLHPLLVSLGAITKNIKTDFESEPLIVACSSDTAVLWLVPALTSFCQQHPEIKLDIRPLQVGEQIPVDVDIAIINQLPEASSYNWSLLSDQDYFPVCTPKLAKQFTDNTLIHAPILHADRGGLWAAWLRESKTPYNQERPQLYLPGGAAVISGALSGLGIALAHRLEVKEALASQQLIRLSPHQIKAAHAYFIATTRQQSSIKANKFIVWLEQYCKTDLKSR